MSSMRPTFEMDLPFGRDYAIHQFEEALQQAPWKSRALCFGNYAELHVPAMETRYWSPHLSLSFEGDDQRTHVRGRIGPRQEIWTFVCILYLSLAFSAFFSLIYCVALWSLGQFTWWCIAPPAAVAGIGLLYVISHIGQSWSMDQIAFLMHECQQVFEKAFPASSGLPTPVVPAELT